MDSKFKMEKIMKYLIIAVLIAAPVSAECRMVCDGAGSTNSAFSDDAPPGMKANIYSDLIKSQTDKNNAVTENLRENQILMQIYGRNAAANGKEVYHGMNHDIMKSVADSLYKK